MQSFLLGDARTQRVEVVCSKLRGFGVEAVG